MSNAQEILVDFLCVRDAKGQRPFTHVSLKNYDRWIINDNDLSEFHRLYANAIKCVPSLEMNIAELVPANSPIIIDFDFLPNDTIISKIVSRFTSILEYMFGDDNDFTCVITRRLRPYNRSTQFCNGIHIQFPYIICERWHLFSLREKFIDDCDINFRESDLNKIYDSHPSPNWLMYFSTKSGKEPYEIIKIFNNEKLEQKKISRCEIVNMLSMRNKNHMLIHPIR
jgi:hypothetical protein